MFPLVFVCDAIIGKGDVSCNCFLIIGCIRDISGKRHLFVWHSFSIIDCVRTMFLTAGLSGILHGFIPWQAAAGKAVRENRGIKWRKIMQDEKIVREEICEIGRRMYARRMVAANDGNISVRLSENELICTPTGVSKGFMKPEQLCKLDFSGNVLEMQEGFGPSSEVKMHIRVYQKRPDIMAVVHAHPVFATSFAVMGRALEVPIMPEVIVNFGKVPLAPYGTPSTAEIPDAIEPYLKDYQAILLESHGTLTWAKDLQTAYMKLESVEFYAELLYRTTQLGGPRVLDEDKLERLYQVIGGPK